MNKKAKPVKDGRKQRPHQSRARAAKRDERQPPWIDSWSAFREYLLHASEKIRRIQIHPQQVSRLDQLLRDCQHRPEQFIIQQNDEIKGLWVEIQLDMHDEIEFLAAIESNPPAMILALDQISDPRNFGAIARTAAFFGVPWILCPKDRQAPLNDGALASAQGAFVYVKAASVVNLSRTLNQLKDRGYWVLGASLEGSDLRTISTTYERSVLVLGNEGRGLRPLVAKNCDVLFQIPGAPHRVESLNVAVAAGIAVQHFCKLGTL